MSFQENLELLRETVELLRQSLDLEHLRQVRQALLDQEDLEDLEFLRQALLWHQALDLELLRPVLQDLELLQQALLQDLHLRQALGQEALQDREALGQEALQDREALTQEALQDLELLRQALLDQEELELLRQALLWQQVLGLVTPPPVKTSWKKGKILGSGSFGTVYEGFTDDGFFIAVKEVSLIDQGTRGKQSVLQLKQEISLLSRFQHENIVRYLGTDSDDGKLYIFLELVTKGSLASLYKKYHLRDSQVSAYTRQLLNGLNYLHKQNVVHRDIKCANILVHESGLVKLADFGLAKAIALNDINSFKGTAFWMAPEVVKGKNYGFAADIWSLGCTVLEMLTRQIPYSPLEWMQALFRIGRDERPPIPDSLSTDAQDFIVKCLEVNPDKRPTAAQLLDHPFVNMYWLSASTSRLAPPHYVGIRS